MSSVLVFDFANLTDKDRALAAFMDNLSRYTRQAVPFVTVEKARRMAGVSVKPIVLTLEQGQTVTLLVRQEGDIFRVQINGKDAPVTTDTTMLKELAKEVANRVYDNQDAFSRRLASAKVAIPKVPRKVQTTAQKLATVTEKTAEVDKAIDEADQMLVNLDTQIEQARHGGMSPNI